MQYPFSDGNPVSEALTAFGILLASILALRIRPLASIIAVGVKWIGKFSRRVGFFTESDATTELRRLDLLRIALALAIAGRFWPEWLASIANGNAASAAWNGVALLLSTMLAPAGRTLSLDSWILQRSGLPTAALGAMYRLWGDVSVDRIQVARLLAFVAYAAINRQSAVLHLTSPTWRAGTATGLILLSSVTNPAWSSWAS